MTFDDILDPDRTPGITSNTRALVQALKALGAYFVDVTIGAVTQSGAWTVTATPGAKPATATASPTRFTNVGANATLNVKSTSGNVFSLSCHSSNAAARYVQLHNTATVPTTGVTVPTYTFLIPAGGQTIIGTDFFTNEGCNFATGIAFAVSTTRDVYTAATAGEHNTTVHYA